MLELFENGYAKFAGKCYEMSLALVEKDSSLILTRGFYHCPYWGRREHWWCVDSQGGIIDPTKDQFPSCGTGDYEEYRGKIICEYCGKEKDEDEAYFNEHHVYCSSRCFARDIGF